MKAMNKSKALDRLSVFFWFVLILIFVNASIWFGSVSYLFCRVSSCSWEPSVWLRAWLAITV